MTTYFISDCHLQRHPDPSNQQFIKFIGQLTGEDTLYILGDLFDIWFGDDHQDQEIKKIEFALRQLSDRGTELFVMQGNRDFLMGKGFCARIGATLLPDPTQIDCQGHDVVITHGDLLCTEDVKYQHFRIMTHTRWLQQLFLMLPLSWRKRIANKVKRTTRATRMDADATPYGITTMLKQFNCHTIIHGHTHKPAIEISYSRKHRRFVLSDWFELGHALACDDSGEFKSYFFR